MLVGCGGTHQVDDLSKDIIEAVETAHRAWKICKDEEAEIKQKKNKEGTKKQLQEEKKRLLEKTEKVRSTLR